MHKRLELERDRLGYTQKELAKIVGTSRVSQGNYEKNLQPKAGYFSAIHDLGFDIFYIITGQRVEDYFLKTDEKFLLEKYRQADKSKQQAVLGMLIMDDAEIPRAVAGELGKGRGSQVGKNTIGDISQSKIGDISQK